MRLLTGVRSLGWSYRSHSKLGHEAQTRAEGGGASFRGDHLTASMPLQPMRRSLFWETVSASLSRKGFEEGCMPDVGELFRVKICTGLGSRCLSPAIHVDLPKRHPQVFVVSGADP